MTGAATGLVVVAAGGTGGHVFPALALVSGLKAQGLTPVFVTDQRGAGFGDELAGVACHIIRSAGLAGRGWRGAIRGAGVLLLGLVQARRLLGRLTPALAIGFGGYASVPPLLAAWSLGIPIVIHEANAVLGRANRLLAPRARAIGTAFPNTAGIRAKDRPRHVCTGNPVRADIIRAAAKSYSAPSPAGTIDLLVVGGSQGSRLFGTILPAALARLPAAIRRRTRLVQQCRSENIETARQAYRKAGIAATLAPFIDDMADQLSEAHLVIARAGASTLAEITAVGRPAVLIPYPLAADDHQTANAEALASAGAAWMVPERDLSPPALAALIGRLLGDADALREAAAHARALGRLDAVDSLISVARGLVCDGASPGGSR